MQEGPGGRGDWWDVLAEAQAGVVARHQLVAGGMSAAQARQGIDGGRWRRLLPGVYATFTGPIPELAHIWAAILYAGPQACASHQTAFWLASESSQDAGRGMGAAQPTSVPDRLSARRPERAPSLIQISIPNERRVTRQPGIRLHVCRDYLARLHPSASPPRTRIEDTALDIADAENDPERALDSIFRVTQRRLSTASRLRTTLSRRARHRWRPLLEQVLAEVEDGVASPLEQRYAKDVERAHGLPRGERNRAEARPGGGHLYRDVRYRAWATVVELDGLEAHPGEERFRDLRRDNHAAVKGESVLRFGWRDVAGRACEAACQVAAVLRVKGWSGSPRRCGPRCRLP